MCPGVPAAFRSRPGLRFDAPEEQADRKPSEESVTAVSAGPPPVPGRCRKPGRVAQDHRRPVRGSVRVLNLEEWKEIKEERKA